MHLGAHRSFRGDCSSPDDIGGSPFGSGRKVIPVIFGFPDFAVREPGFGAGTDDAGEQSQIPETAGFCGY